MFEYIFGILVGFYSGGAFVSSVVSETVDGEPAKWTDTLMLSLLWPVTMYQASQNEEEQS